MGKGGGIPLGILGIVLEAFMEVGSDPGDHFILPPMFSQMDNFYFLKRLRLL